MRSFFRTYCVVVFLLLIPSLRQHVCAQTRQLKGVGAVSNSYGFYSLTIPRGTYTLLIQNLGYKVRADTLVLDTKSMVPR